MQKIGWTALVWIFTWETFLRRSVFNWLLVFVEARKPAYIYARGRSAALQWFSSLLKTGPTNPSWSKAAVKAPKMSFKFPKVVWFGHAAPPSDRCDQGGSRHLSLHLTWKIGLRIFMSASSENSWNSLAGSLSRPPWPSCDPCVARSGQTAKPYRQNTSRWPLCPFASCGPGARKATPTRQFFFVFFFFHCADSLLLCSLKVKRGQRATIFHLFLFSPENKQACKSKLARN